VLVFFILLAIGFGANLFGRGFRLYSLGTILILVGFGALTGLDGLRIRRIPVGLPRGRKLVPEAEQFHPPAGITDADSF
jgi:hypothetical protein